jgi:hypothetical protein
MTEETVFTQRRKGAKKNTSKRGSAFASLRLCVKHILHRVTFRAKLLAVEVLDLCEESLILQNF